MTKRQETLITHHRANNIVVAFFGAENERIINNNTLHCFSNPGANVPTTPQFYYIIIANQKNIYCSFEL